MGEALGMGQGQEVETRNDTQVEIQVLNLPCPFLLLIKLGCWLVGEAGERVVIAGKSGDVLLL